MRHAAVWIVEGRKHDVFDAALGLEVAGTRGADGFGRGPEEIVGDGNVMRGERPPSVLLSANDAEIDTLCVDIEHVAKLAVVDEAFETLDGRMIEEQMTNHENPAALFGEPAQRGGLISGKAERLLDEHISPGAQCGFGYLEVRRRVRGDYNRDHRGVLENDGKVGDDVYARVERSHRLPNPFVPVADVTQIGFRNGRVVANVVLAPTACPHDGDPYCL
jgi:hypothetical protein